MYLKVFAIGMFLTFGFIFVGYWTIILPILGIMGFGLFRRIER